MSNSFLLIPLSILVLNVNAATANKIPQLPNPPQSLDQKKIENLRLNPIPKKIEGLPIQEKKPPKRQDFVSGGIHGGGGGDASCAEFIDLIKLVQNEIEEFNLVSNFQSQEYKCIPQVNLSDELIARSDETFFLNTERWLELPMNSKLWHLLKSATHDSLDSQNFQNLLEQFVQISEVFSQYRSFDRMDRKDSQVTLHNPKIILNKKSYPIGFERWVKSRSGDQDTEVFLNPQIKNPSDLAAQYCRFLGYKQFVSATWHIPIYQKNDQWPWWRTTKSVEFAILKNGLFNGTASTHYYGYGEFHWLRSVTCQE